MTEESLEQILEESADPTFDQQEKKRKKKRGAPEPGILSCKSA